MINTGDYILIRDLNQEVINTCIAGPTRGFGAKNIEILGMDFNRDLGRYADLRAQVVDKETWLKETAALITRHKARADKEFKEAYSEFMRAINETIDAHDLSAEDVRAKAKIKLFEENGWSKDGDSFYD